MIILAKTIGLVICGLGLFFTILPEKVKVLFEFWKQGNRFYGNAILRIFFAVVLFSAAAKCRIPSIALLLGVLFLLSGILIFIIGIDKMKEQLQWLEGQTPLAFRILGLIALSFGLMILYTV